MVHEPRSIINLKFYSASQIFITHTTFSILFFSACKSNFEQSLKHKYGSVREIPPFQGVSSFNMYNKLVDTIKKSSTG